MISKILLVDDIQDNLDLLEDLLDDEFNYGESEYKLEFIQAVNGQDALDMVVNNTDIDLILLDVMMPNIDGFEVCKRLKGNVLTQHIPIIFITAKAESVDIVKGFELGASDYVSKPFQEEELLARVKKELKIQSLIKNLEFLSSHDTMTGIYNRRKFFELAHIMFEKNRDDLYIAMIDIDKFKNINDKYGHNIGDEVIIEVTKRITQLKCKDSVFGRIGGEEFALICKAELIDHVIDKTETIRKTIESLSIIDNGEELKFTISVGVKAINDNIKTVEEFLNEADIALYEAKNSGRNKVVFNKKDENGI